MRKLTKILTQTEKTIAIIEEYIAFTKKIEEKYDLRIVYNLDKIGEKRVVKKKKR